MSDEFLFNSGIKIKTSQCDKTDFVSIEPVELHGREYPWSKEEILEELKDENKNSVRTMLNYRPQAWCLFRVENGDIHIERLTVKNETLLHDVMDSLFGTISYTPKKQACVVTMDWPEYATDHFLFKYLLATGWQTEGLIRDKYWAYGELWDGIKLVRVFNGG